MKKFLATLSLILFGCTAMAFADGFNSNHIIPENNVDATISKRHPVITLTNTVDYDLKITYNYYISEASDPKIDQKSGEILVPAKSQVSLSLPDLAFLGEREETRRIWFSWNEESKLKPLETSIDTIIFKSKPINQLG